MLLNKFSLRVFLCTASLKCISVLPKFERQKENSKLNPAFPSSFQWSCGGISNRISTKLTYTSKRTSLCCKHICIREMNILANTCRIAKRGRCWVHFIELLGYICLRSTITAQMLCHYSIASST